MYTEPYLFNLFIFLLYYCMDTGIIAITLLAGTIAIGLITRREIIARQNKHKTQRKRGVRKSS